MTGPTCSFFRSLFRLSVCLFLSLSLCLPLLPTLSLSLSLSGNVLCHCFVFRRQWVVFPPHPTPLYHPSRLFNYLRSAIFDWFPWRGVPSRHNWLLKASETSLSLRLILQATQLLTWRKTRFYRPLRKGETNRSGSYRFS